MTCPFLYRTAAGIVVACEGRFAFVADTSWDELLRRDDLPEHVAALVPTSSDPAAATAAARPLAPLQNQEVWAAGVTYISSRLAREEEAQAAGGGDFYRRVYHAARPEIFFKAMPRLVAGPGEPVRIRRDSTWNVPEPELALLCAPSGRITGYTIGNDMSSRSIEGENPLYLPQAKTYDGCAALGPALAVPANPPAADTRIRLRIERSGKTAFTGATELGQMKRTPPELAGFLFRETSFPAGVFLMTGTGIVPGPDFTLEPGDRIVIAIDGLGELINPVA